MIDLLPSPGTLAALYAVAFAIAVIYLFKRLRKEASEQERARVNTRTDIRRRAIAAGRRMVDGTGRTQWTQHGALADGTPWTLAQWTALKSGYLPDDRHPSHHYDRLSGMHLEWRCPALARPQAAFSFHRRSRGRDAPTEIIMQGDTELWRRWQLEAGDESAARRAFTPAVCAVLAQIPKPIATNLYLDERTSIVLGNEGLVSVLGVYDLVPDTVDAWIQANQAIAEALMAVTLVASGVTP